jgi:hypothetical protein
MASALFGREHLVPHLLAAVAAVAAGVLVGTGMAERPGAAIDTVVDAVAPPLAARPAVAAPAHSPAARAVPVVRRRAVPVVRRRAVARSVPAARRHVAATPLPAAAHRRWGRPVHHARAVARRRPAGLHAARAHARGHRHGRRAGHRAGHRHVPKPHRRHRAHHGHHRG